MPDIGESAEGKVIYVGARVEEMLSSLKERIGSEGWI